MVGLGGLVVRSRPRNPIPLKIRRVWGLLHAKSYVVAKRPPPLVWRASLGRGMPSQVSSSSSDRDSKLRGIALVLLQKRDVNPTYMWAVDSIFVDLENLFRSQRRFKSPH
ncbi:hypothetical protein AVEN_150486-1 [Araneus ventricosus]|uniref:Uncharacterized protein n=1 Tax=Araneus ventricosus TaxID=182803 RepID=A0A4Y2H957_ARAVE|nr:hypothetical protein AVEN_150486-1 [Araneus ventricosus]